MTPEQIEVIMNQTEVIGSEVIVVFVPTRSMRVLKLAEDKIFRVEQLDPGVWKWRTLSTHAGDEPWESYQDAWEAGSKAQTRLKLKIQEAQRQRRQADLAVQNEGLV